MSLSTSGIVFHREKPEAAMPPAHAPHTIQPLTHWSVVFHSISRPSIIKTHENASD
jgi:hypothetical protein